jgi:hypothetical protein
MAERTDASSATSHLDCDRTRPGLRRRIFNSLTTPGEQRNLIAASGKSDPNTAPEPARGADHYCSRHTLLADRSW